MSNEKKLAKQQEKERKAELKRQATADKLRAKALAAEEVCVLFRCVRT